MAMNLQQALDLLDAAAARTAGTRKDHENLASASLLVRQELQALQIELARRSQFEPVVPCPVCNTTEACLDDGCAAQ